LIFRLETGGWLETGNYIAYEQYLHGGQLLNFRTVLGKSEMKANIWSKNHTICRGNCITWQL